MTEREQQALYSFRETTCACAAAFVQSLAGVLRLIDDPKLRKTLIDAGDGIADAAISITEHLFEEQGKRKEQSTC